MVDSARALAVLMVVLFHVSGWVGADLSPGVTRLLAHLNLGVPLFFVISGFLLYRPFVAARVGSGPEVRFLQYGRRRLLRILPAYWVALTILTILPTAFAAANRPWVWYGFIQSYPPALVGLKCSAAIGPGSHCGLPQAWSLSVEMTFYLLLPGYVALISHFSKGTTRRRMLALDAVTLAALGAASLAAVGLWSTNRPSSLAMTVANPLGIGGTFVWFAFGMIFAVASVNSESTGQKTRRFRYGAELTWAIGIGLYVLICFALPLSNLPTGMSAWQRVSEWGLFGIVAACLVGPTIFGDERGLVRRLLSSPLLHWLGLISYGIFLWHLPVLQLLLSRSSIVTSLPGNSFVTATVLTLAGSIACGALSYYVIERPFLLRKERRLQRGRSAIRAAATRLETPKVKIRVIGAMALVVVIGVEALRVGDPPRWRLQAQASSLLAAAGTPQGQPIGSVNELSAVAAVGSEDAWAVGSSTDLEHTTSPLSEHWNGSKWAPIAAVLGGVSSTLSAVAASGPNDVWAVGSFVDAQHTKWPLSEHWDGTAWNVEVPIKGGVSSSLSGVATLGSADVWAVGSYRDDNGNIWPMAQHWNGHSWEMSETIQGGSSSLFSAVTAISADDVWAVGAFKSSADSLSPLSEHWNGERWSVVQAPKGGSSSIFAGVTATSPADVWAVGAYTDIGGVSWPLVERWNGQSWSVPDRGDRGGDRGIPPSASLVPAGEGVSASFTSVTATGPDDVWAVGYFARSPGADHPFAEHWNGTLWWITVPPTSGPTSEFDSVVAVARDEVLAVGRYKDADGVTRPLLESWASPH
jgi:peptidoglycan/LPS O-acetylase OafA/YrhL